MSRRVVRSELVLSDRDELSEYTRQRNPRAALRFLGAAEATFRRLAATPNIGERFASDDPVYQELRCLPISGFPSHIGYYTPLADGVVDIRVIHGARDIDQIFPDEFAGPGLDPLNS
jgi:toxin ParE1/3/4